MDNCQRIILILANIVKIDILKDIPILERRFLSKIYAGQTATR